MVDFCIAVRCYDDDGTLPKTSSADFADVFLYFFPLSGWMDHFDVGSIYRQHRDGPVSAR